MATKPLLAGGASLTTQDKADIREQIGATGFVSGLDATGATDSYALIQAAVDSAVASGGEAVVRLPPGVFRVSASLILPSYITLSGAGMGVTVLRMAAGALSASGSIRIVGKTYVNVRDLTIDHATNGTNSNGIAIVPAGVDAGSIPTGTKSSYIQIERVEVLGYDTHQYLIWCQGGEHVKIANCLINGGVSSYASGSSQDGIEIYGGDDILVQGNTVQNVGSTGMWTFSDSTAPSERAGIRLLNNHIEKCKTGIGGHNASNAAHIHYKGNVVKNCWTAGILFNAEASVILKDVQISGNSVSEIGGQGIAVSGQAASSSNYKDISITNNTVNIKESGTPLGHGIQLSNMSNALVSGNVVSKALNGIFITSTSGSGLNIDVTGNKVSSVYQYGIHVYDCTRVFIAGNTLRGYNLSNGGYSGVYFTSGHYCTAVSNAFNFGGAAETAAIYADAGSDHISIGINRVEYAAAIAAYVDASSTSNIFYEEGSWTPTWSTASGSGATVNNAFGRYTKIGNRVFVDIYISTNGHGTSSGNVTVGGLPYTSSPVTNSNNGVLALSQAFNMSIVAGQSVSGQVQYGSKNIIFIIWNATSGTSQMTATQWGVSGGVRASGSYLI